MQRLQLVMNRPLKRMFEDGIELLTEMPAEVESPYVAAVAARGARAAADETPASGCSLDKRRWYSPAEQRDPDIYDEHAQIWQEFVIKFHSEISDPLEGRCIDSEKFAGLFTDQHVRSCISSLRARLHRTLTCGSSAGKC